MRNNINDGLHQVFTGQPPPPGSRRQADWLIEGKITAVSSGTHTATFVVPDWDAGKDFTNRPYGDGNATPPNIGDICLIAFPGTGIERGWIVSWHTPD